MAYHKDFNFVIQGDVVAYSSSRGREAASLPRGRDILLRFPAVEGKIQVGVSAYDVNLPSRTRKIGGTGSDVDESSTEGPGTLITEFNHIAVQIDLIPPDQSAPVRSLKTKSGFSQTEAFGFEHEVGAPAPKGEWVVRVKNVDRKTATVDLRAFRVFDRKPLRTEFLAHRLIDHTNLVILEALQPSAEVSGRTLTLKFSEELRKFFGAGDSGPLGTHVISLPDVINVAPPARLSRFEVRARSGRALLDAVIQRFEAVKKSLETQLNQLANLPAANAAIVRKTLNNALTANNRFRQEWERRVRSDDAVVHIKASFTDINITATLDILTGIDADAEAVLRNVTADVYIAFDRSLERCRVLALSPLEIEFKDFEAKVLNKLLDLLGINLDLNGIIEEELPPIIERAGPQISRFLAEALARLVSRNGVFHNLTANENHWLVRYTALPGEPEPVPVPTGVPHTIHSGTSVSGGGVSDVGSPGGGVLQDPGGPGPAPDPTLGVLPAEFVVVNPETLARLDKIETMVFVMMENRSFDHMLGYLRKARGPQYEGLRGNESNPLEGSARPVRMRPAPEIVGSPATQIKLDPNHGFAATEKQIAGGAMSGFAQDFENKHPGFGDTVMTFYTDKEVKVFDQLAADYKVCDHWFCAHAGPTFPNRFVTLSGTAPLVNNHKIDDPDLGFLQGRTVFDLLNERAIRWALFESDLSIIRMYNQFRLNASEIRPYKNRFDDSQSFAAVAARGELPPVVFVEPNFSSIPPISTANDDHPPADIRLGQKFIGDVVQALQLSPQWQGMMVVITYDEHGGFYDHVAPPGTRLGSPEFFDANKIDEKTGEKGVGLIPLIHPEGRDFMGPRVPSFVISPFVSAGSVCKDILDHTSIIKTILLRHRAKIPTRMFAQFGPRVNQIAHLGVALDLDEPRNDQPKPLAKMVIRPAEDTVGRFHAVTAAAKPDEDDFHESIRRAPLPKRG